MARSDSGESVLERAVRIFEAFDAESERLTVGALARRAQLPTSTASRLVEQLVELGLLHRGADNSIGIGLRMWELAARAAPTRGLREAALPFLEDLHAVVGHHVQLAVLDGEQVLFIERLTAPGSVVNFTQVAGRLPLHASSSGLVLLAHAGPEQLDRVLAPGLVRFTVETITEPSALRRVLADIRRSGSVVCAGHLHSDATGIAVPIRDPKRTVVAAVSTVVPRRGSVPSAHVHALQATARGIERALRGPSPG